jgi:hypothetical protein
VYISFRFFVFIFVCLFFVFCCFFFVFCFYFLFFVGTNNVLLVYMNKIRVLFRYFLSYIYCLARKILYTLSFSFNKSYTYSYTKFIPLICIYMHIKHIRCNNEIHINHYTQTTAYIWSKEYIDIYK